MESHEGAVPDILGVTPPLAEVVREFQHSSLAGHPLEAAESMGRVLEQLTEGKDGPLLLVADGNKLRIMELKPDQK